MIAVDTNILVYAAELSSPWHSAASAVVRALAEARTNWAIPWPCIYEFLSVVTNPRIYAPGSTPAEALNHVETWLESPELTLLSEPDDFLPTLKETITRSVVVGGAVHDARIAALCLYHGVTTLYSADRDFSRFPRLKTHNPLV